MKKGHTRIAEHFCCDSSEIRDYEYQPGRFSVPVYSLSNNQYWAGSKPKDKAGMMLDWKPVASTYDGSTLWMHQN